MESTGHRITRRDMVKLSLLGTAALALPLQRGAQTESASRLRRLPVPFRVDLPTLRPLPTTRTTATTDFYDITMEEGTADIIPGKSTPIWGYNGRFPGPMIQARSGRRAEVTFTNRLPVHTSVHNHGAYVDGDSDGHPEDLIPPGGSKTYAYNNDENARFQWYHDHAAHVTAPNVYNGLAGLYLIGDKFEDDLPLPKEEYDVPLVIQDRLFEADGAFLYPFDEDDHSANGVEGDVVLVNGKPWPRMAVANRRYRLRILNGSNARVYRLALSNRQPLTVIGTEGGMIDKPVKVSSLPIASAERYEVVVDFADVPVGGSVVLKNLGGKDGTANVMRFDVTRRAKDDSTVPPVLRPPKDQEDPTHLPADPSEAVRTRRWVFKRQHGFWSINGKIWDPDRIDADPREGEVEIWEFVNNGGGWVHPIHTHLTDFKILSRNGRAPHPWERGWKETVFLDGNDVVRVLIRWPEVPVEGTGEFTRRYAYHCHLVEHEDHDMMLQFEVRA